MIPLNQLGYISHRVFPLMEMGAQESSSPVRRKINKIMNPYQSLHSIYIISLHFSPFCVIFAQEQSKVDNIYAIQETRYRSTKRVFGMVINS